MRLRFHSILALLLACLMLGVGTQSGVCELACNLGSSIQCHSESAVTAGSQHAGGMMAGMRCSGMMDERESTSTTQFESPDSGPCGHPSPIAALNYGTSNEGIAAVHWIVVEAAPVQAMASAHRPGTKASTPPLHHPTDSFLLPLRV